jgi:outer membrane protein assembly factor BamB
MRMRRQACDPPDAQHWTRRGSGFGAAVSVALLCAGCSTLSTWIPTIPPPSFGWLSSIFGSSSKKLGPLPDFKTTATAQVVWQVALGKSAPGLAPAITPGAVYAASSGGTLVRVDPASGAVVWRIEAGMRLAAGVGADATLVAVGTDKGDVLAFDTSGKALWQVKLTSEVLGPPKVAEGTVVVWTGDGRIHGLSSADGKTRWVYQRTNPPLTIRNYAGGVVSRGGIFSGTAGGKLLAMDVATGNVGWEGNVATPKGATELERIADVTSLPLVEERQVCAVAFQGRIACFEILRGDLAWTRDVSSLTGLAVDGRFLYLADDAGAVYALDNVTGASAWKQDKLMPRHVGGAQIAGDFLLVLDPEGYVYLLDRNDGNLVGRAPTDGTPATAQPAQSGANAVWQTNGGTLYAVTAR